MDRYSFSRLDCLFAAALVALPRGKVHRHAARRARRNHIGQFALCFSRSFKPCPVFGILIGRHAPAADNLISPDCRRRLRGNARLLQGGLRPGRASNKNRRQDSGDR